MEQIYYEKSLARTARARGTREKNPKKHLLHLFICYNQQQTETLLQETSTNGAPNVIFDTKRWYFRE